MNPTVPQDFIDAEFERDAASAAAEYGAEFRSDVAEFVSMDVLEMRARPTACLNCRQYPARAMSRSSIHPAVPATR